MRARGELSPRCPWVVMKRPHGTGTLYVKWGSYYGRWLAPDGRRVNRRIGKVRVRGKARGLTRAEAERGLRRLIEAESLRPPPPVEERPRTVDELADELRERLAIGRVTGAGLVAALLPSPRPRASPSTRDLATGAEARRVPRRRGPGGTLPRPAADRRSP